MECSCGNKEATFWKSGFFKNDQGERECYEYCNKCGDAGPVYVPDVFWDGKPEENLADGPDGKPRVFLSKGQKAQYLKEREICEGGDKFHGAPFTTLGKKDKAQEKRQWDSQVQQARKKVESMGKDVRRQAILKVIREARQYEAKAER